MMLAGNSGSYHRASTRTNQKHLSGSKETILVHDRGETSMEMNRLQQVFIQFYHRLSRRNKAVTSSTQQSTTVTNRGFSVFVLCFPCDSFALHCFCFPFSRSSHLLFISPPSPYNHDISSHPTTVYFHIHCRRTLRRPSPVEFFVQCRFGFALATSAIFFLVYQCAA